MDIGNKSSRLVTNRTHELSLAANQINNNSHMATIRSGVQLDAVIIRNLTYEVGRGRSKRAILNRINLTVPEGSIYGLLGPSGCGKTTMLRCVVGRLRAKPQGSVLVFGLTPGDRRGQVPGRDIGYMPQEISIYEDFTIEETLVYFGKINRMQGAQIRARVEFLVHFLDLPSKSRPVVNLSGGQKRRVSLAAALVHSPPLLILDEPTVGVDPLLRQNIWRHLVTLTKRERISVIITTHYIEEARQAHVVGLMRNGRILAENSPEELMRQHSLATLEDVFLELCVTDSTSGSGQDLSAAGSGEGDQLRPREARSPRSDRGAGNNMTKVMGTHRDGELSSSQSPDLKAGFSGGELPTRHGLDVTKGPPNSRQTPTTTTDNISSDGQSQSEEPLAKQPSQQSQSGPQIRIHTSTNRIELSSFSNETLDFSLSEETTSFDSDTEHRVDSPPPGEPKVLTNPKILARIQSAPDSKTMKRATFEHNQTKSSTNIMTSEKRTTLEYLTSQALGWAARRNNELNMINFHLSNRAFVDGSLSAINNPIELGGEANKNGTSNKHHRNKKRDKHHSHQNPQSMIIDSPWLDRPSSYSSSSNSRLMTQQQLHRGSVNQENAWLQWWRTLWAVTWKNYVRLRRNPPVLIFQFMLPAIQVILFCLCIGGEPFDVPVAIVNEESVPRSSLQFLNGLDKRVIRQLKYDNLSSAIDAVKKGHVWGAIHIPDKYSHNLQSRLIMGEDVTNETLTNGTIRVYPDLTNLHLALALETTFRETFINFARNSLEDMGYEKSLADLPIQLGTPIYGNLKKDSYLEFMAPGVVISISYVMATGLTALAFILERRDGLLERSLVSGVDTSQILLAHAINQVVVMVIQIFLVLGCTFFVFEIPSRGPFFWVVLLILLQGCTGMSFGLLVSAICKEENTAVMMVVGTFYTNLILAGIIWPVEAMPHWLRPVSYAQPQTLATDTLRHILSRGWGIGEPAVLLGFVVTLGWLMVFLVAAGLIFKYSR